LSAARVAVGGLVAAAALLVALLPPAAAQDPSTTTTAPLSEDPGGGIVPEPDSGVPPTEAGDRGGALQLALLGLVIVVLVAGVVQLRRHSRRARASGEAGPARR
jgi:hypothetical protein